MNRHNARRTWTHGGACLSDFKTMKIRSLMLSCHISLGEAAEAEGVEIRVARREFLSRGWLTSGEWAGYRPRDIPSRALNRWYYRNRGRWIPREHEDVCRDFDRADPEYMRHWPARRARA